MSTKFFTNKDENSLFNKLKGIFEHQDIYHFDALIGYFRASGYFKVRPLLENVPQIRILVGINVDELAAHAKRMGQLYLEDTEKTKDEFINVIADDISKATYSAEIEHGVIQFIEDIISEKVLIRANGNKEFINHAKIYIFRPEPFNQHTHGSVITGSSNLTDAGLGTKTVPNYEFNVLLKDFEDVQFATQEFEGIWKQSTEILPVDIKKAKKTDLFK